MFSKKELSKPVSPTKNSPCESCSKITVKILQLEEDLKAQEETQKKLQFELEHSRAIQDQQRLLYEKRIEDLKQSSYPDSSPKSPSVLSKDKELQSLKFEIKQRDSLLTKAKKLVTVLSEELSQKTKEIEELQKFARQDLQTENEKLKERIHELETAKDSHKQESFSFDTESFGSKVIKNSEKDAMCQKLESDLAFLSNQLSFAQDTLRGTCDENARLKDLISNLESRMLFQQKEAEEASQTIFSLENALEEARKKQFQLESDYQDLLRSNRSSLSMDDFNKIMTQKESVICELTSQVIKKQVHRRHRHNSHVRETYELLDAIKNEIKTGTGPANSLSKESYSILKDFQTWYRSHKFNPNAKFISEVLLVLLANAKGRNKGEIEKIVNNFQDLEIQELERCVLKHVKNMCLVKGEILNRVKGINSSLKMGTESIDLVCAKIEELQDSLTEENVIELEGKVVELTLGFLKEFGKERLLDYDNSCEILRILM